MILRPQSRPCSTLLRENTTFHHATVLRRDASGLNAIGISRSKLSTSGSYGFIDSLFRSELVVRRAYRDVLWVRGNPVYTTYYVRPRVNA